MPVVIAGVTYYRFADGLVADRVPGTQFLDPAQGAPIEVRDDTGTVVVVRRVEDETVFTMVADEYGNYPRFLAPMVFGTINAGLGARDVVSVESALALLDVPAAVAAAQTSAASATAAAAAAAVMAGSVEVVDWVFDPLAGWPTERPPAAVGKLLNIIMPSSVTSWPSTAGVSWLAQDDRVQTVFAFPAEGQP